MKKALQTVTVTLAVVLLLFLFSSAEAQHGHGGPPGGMHVPAGGFHPPSSGMHMPSGGFHPSGPNLGAVSHQFGAGSVVHRDFNPNPPMHGPDFSPIGRPNLPRIPDHPEGLYNFHGGHPNIENPSGPVRPERPDGPGHNIVGPPDRGPNALGFPGGPRPDGPDWKHWKDFDSSKIHDSVRNRPDFDNHSIDMVRNDFHEHYGDQPFWTPDWYHRHPGSWHPHGPPPPPSAWWYRPTWDRTWGWFGAGFFGGFVANTILNPIPYYYGNNVVYTDNMVYVNNVPYVSAEEYYQQAIDLASAAPAPITETTVAATQTGATESEWLPMGTFAIVSDPKQESSQRILQLATNKNGEVRGNLVNTKTDKVTELYGNVDSKTQRVAFKVVGNDEVVVECGLWNLTQDTVPILIHISKYRTEERTMIRLTQEQLKSVESSNVVEP